MDYFFYLVVVSLLLCSASLIVRSTYSKYAEIRTSSDKTGCDVVIDMKNKYSLNNVNIEVIPGVLTDHYNPKRKTIALSKGNYYEATIAGIAVAAHEMGHAIQDKNRYFFFRLRQGMGKLTIVASNLSWIIIFLGFVMWTLPLVYFGIVLFAITVIFEIITLPVELDASRRAKEYLSSTGAYTKQEVEGMSKVLNAAAFTYIASTLAGILQLIRLLGIVRSRD